MACRAAYVVSPATQSLEGRTASGDSQPRWHFVCNRVALSGSASLACIRRLHLLFVHLTADSIRRGFCPPQLFGIRLHFADDGAKVEQWLFGMTHCDYGPVRKLLIIPHPDD